LAAAAKEVDVMSVRVRETGGFSKRFIFDFFREPSTSLLQLLILLLQSILDVEDQKTLPVGNPLQPFGERMN
jgi:hypothetical protein